MTSTTKTYGDRHVRGMGFCVLLKLRWYKSKVKCYNFRMLNVIPMGTTKNIAMEYVQKERRKELKCFTTKKSTKHKRIQLCMKLVIKNL